MPVSTRDASRKNARPTIRAVLVNSAVYILISLGLALVSAKFFPTLVDDVLAFAYKADAFYDQRVLVRAQSLQTFYIAAEVGGLQRITTPVVLAIQTLFFLSLVMPLLLCINIAVCYRQLASFSKDFRNISLARRLSSTLATVHVHPLILLLLVAGPAFFITIYKQDLPLFKVTQGDGVYTDIAHMLSDIDTQVLAIDQPDNLLVLPDAGSGQGRFKLLNLKELDLYDLPYPLIHSTAGKQRYEVLAYSVQDPKTGAVVAGGVKTTGHHSITTHYADSMQALQNTDGSFLLYEPAFRALYHLSADFSVLNTLEPDELVAQIGIDTPAQQIRIRDDFYGEISLADGRHYAINLATREIVQRLPRPTRSKHLRHLRALSYSIGWNRRSNQRAMQLQVIQKRQADRPEIRHPAGDWFLSPKTYLESETGFLLLSREDLTDQSADTLSAFNTKGEMLWQQDNIRLPSVDSRYTDLRPKYQIRSAGTALIILSRNVGGPLGAQLIDASSGRTLWRYAIAEKDE